MKLSKLYKGIDNSEDFEVTGIKDNSKDIISGDIFVCIKGKKFNAHNFIGEAIVNGAKVIVSEEKINKKIIEENPDVVFIEVSDTKKELAELSNKIFGEPSKKLDIIGVTGTDGKTTTASIISHILSTKYSSAYIGTNGVQYKDIKDNLPNTTPNSLTLNSLLDSMSSSDIKKVALEVSSIAIKEKRINEINFDMGVYTNLSLEHLDYHGSMLEYFAAKNEFMSSLSKDKVLFINMDDQFADEIINTAKATIVTYSINNFSHIRAINIKRYKTYTTFDLIYYSEIYKDVKTNLVGDYNILNILASIGVARSNYIPFSMIFESIKNIPRIEGRYEKISLGQDFDCIVDFAHTPNALENLLDNVRENNKEGNIILVCGSAGEKDRAKRKLIGDIATDKSNIVIFTSEDPRSEDPSEIIDEMLSITDNINYLRILDRKKAIKAAIKLANENDTVLITGKGNEYTEEIEGRNYYHNDIEIAKEFIADLKIFPNNDIDFKN